MAVPPLAEMLSCVLFAMVPPSTPTDPTVSPTPMALPALPPLLMSPVATAPPLAEAVATPPLPAEAVSVNCMMISPSLVPPRGGSPRLSYGIRPECQLRTTEHQGGDVQKARECHCADRWANPCRTVLPRAVAGVGCVAKRARRPRCGDPRHHGLAGNAGTGTPVPAFAPIPHAIGAGPRRDPRWRGVLAGYTGKIRCQLHGHLKPELVLRRR